MFKFGNTQEGACRRAWHDLTSSKRKIFGSAAAIFTVAVFMIGVGVAKAANAGEGGVVDSSSNSPVFINDSTPGKLTVAKTVNDTAGTTTNFTYKIVLNTPDKSSLLNNWTCTSLTGKVLSGTITVADVEPGDTVKATLGNDGTLTASGTNLSYEWHKVSEDGSDDVVGDDSNSYATQNADDGCSFYCIVRDSSGTYTGWVKSNEAKCKKANKVKYAVQLYGINADTDENNDILDLTFGPALGANYASSYKACADKTSGCIHTDSWETIIKHVNDGDAANVYAACLTNGCTKTVELSLNDTIGSGTYQQASGDGYGALYTCIASDYRRWNSILTNSGGWKASQIRAVLNGKTSDTSTDNAFKKSNGSVFTSIDASNSLLSCFPSELQGAIKAKAVNTRTTYNDSNSVSTTYDKLWLLSYAEISTDDDNDMPTDEGSKYLKFSSVSNARESSYSDLQAYVDTDYSAAGSTYRWWLRSSGANDASAFSIRDYVGIVYYYSTTGIYLALAPGFCLG